MDVNKEAIEQDIEAQWQRLLRQIKWTGLESREAREVFGEIAQAGAETYEALVMVRDADDDRFEDGDPDAIPEAARAKIDAAIAAAEITMGRAK